MKLDELLDRQVAIINVGMSTADGIPGPLFKDGIFRFIPIPDGSLSERLPTYEEMGLGAWVSHPQWKVHNDPEFETMTFGDYKLKNGELNIRVANALKLRPDDFLFFFSSLSTEEHRKKRKTTGMFLIGYFEIERIIPYDEAKDSPLTRNNAHIRRTRDSGFSIWKGTSRSALLKFAVPMDSRSVDLWLRTSKGKRLPWGSIDKSGRRRSDLEVINSATRASRLILPEYRRAFWTLVKARNPDLPVFP
jgi:hypothetical protein